MKIIRFVLCLLSLNGIVFGAGFALYEHSAAATGMAGAFAATADDPGALFYNPAGIAFQKSSLYLETTVIRPEATFEGSGEYPGQGVKEKMTQQYFYPSNFSFIQPLGKKWTFGIGMFNPFGLGTEWEHSSTFSGRFLSTKAEIQGYNLASTLAYRPIDNLSVALGVHYLAAELSLQQYKGAINPYTQTVTNIAHIRMDGDRDGNYGWDFGLLYKFGVSSVGLTYHSHTKIDFDGVARISQVYTGYADFDALVAAGLPVGNHDVTTGIDFPAMALLGIATQATPELRFEFDLGWTGWSSYDKLDVNFADIPSLSTTRETKWSDSYTYRFGMEYKISASTALRAGILYDQTPQPTQEMSPLLPDSDRVGFCLGYGKTMKKISLDAGYMYLTFKDRSTKGIQQDGYNGTYQEKAHLLGVSLTYHF